MDNQQESYESNKQKKITLLPIFIIIAIVLAVIIGATVYQQQKNKQKYQAAIGAMQGKEYELAITLFQELGEYGDSAEMIQKCYDSQSLDYLQAFYQAINTLQKLENKLTDIVSTIIGNVDTLNSINGDSLLDKRSYLISASYKDAISNLYNGKGYSAYRSCSYFDASRIKAAVGSSADIHQGSSGWYNVYVPIHTEKTALAFVDALESANSLTDSIKETIADIGILSEKYREVQEQLLLTYESLESYHAFASSVPNDYENYSKTAQEYKVTVENLLSIVRQLEPAISSK